MEHIQDKLKHVSSYTSKLLRKKFGRGPESCYAAINNRYLVFYIRGFISPMEEVLLQEKRSKSVTSARRTIITSTVEELKGVIQVTFDLEVAGFYHDWNFPNNSGVIIAALQHEENRFIKESAGDMEPVDIAMLEDEVNRISRLVQKVPNETTVHQISPTIYVVLRVGILIPIEKALISKGFEKELLFTKDELEKAHFHRSGRFEQIFKRQVNDIFVDWNLKEDKGLMCFVLKS